MTLESAQREIAESQEYNRVLDRAKATCELIYALHQMTMIRNRPRPDMAPELLAQRRAIMDVGIQILKADFKRSAQELMEALQRWEEF